MALARSGCPLSPSMTQSGPFSTPSLSEWQGGREGGRGLPYALIHAHTLNTHPPTHTHTHTHSPRPSERLAGPVNVVSPQPATNADFVAALAGALHRPAFIPMPEFVVRAVFGEMGEETLLASQKAAPKKLADTGFTFEHPGIREACQQALLK